VVDKAVAEFGAIDILVNNAGAYEVRGWADATPQEWLDTFNQDVLSMVCMIRLSEKGPSPVRATMVTPMGVAALELRDRLSLPVDTGRCTV
jgi:NAD(P)-dependent dehydrogenase (short-subunit alcohol dehydrogenase family)